MNKTRIAVVGSSGRMGAEIVTLARADERFVFTAGVARTRVSHIDTIHAKVDELKKEDIDVVIDFSLPEGFKSALHWSVKNEKPFVSGTTGISDHDKFLLKEASEKIPVLWSPNMSLGVAVLNRALKNLPKLEDFEFQVEEFHHSKKKDRPSGTALLLQQTLEEKYKDLPEPLSIRGGGIFGIHRVHLMSQEETLCFEHQALNRAVFARGALLASRWIHNKGPGLYNMQDVLGA